MSERDLLLRLAVALAVGLLMGLERGWREREASEGGRVAGVRTFGILSVLGALVALVSQPDGQVLLGLAFLAVAALLAAAHVCAVRRHGDYGITTVVAALGAFVLGAVAMGGELIVAAAAAVLLTLLLGAKAQLHGWIRRLEQHELSAALKLLLISVLVLPVLPDRGYGPWRALNPYEIWWMVVLVAGLSFAGYFAVKLVGARRGLALTAILGGLVSSTAVTLGLARIARDTPRHGRLCAAGVGLASGTMFLRTLLVAGVVEPRLVAPLAPTLVAMAAAAYGAAAWALRGGSAAAEVSEPALHNPFELRAALQVGGLLAAVMLLARAMKAWLGEGGVYLLALVSGIADVDPVTLSVARMARDELALGAAATAVTIAAGANTVVKAVLIAVIARGAMARVAAGVVGAALLAGAVAVALTRG